MIKILDEGAGSYGGDVVFSGCYDDACWAIAFNGQGKGKATWKKNCLIG